MNAGPKEKSENAGNAGIAGKANSTKGKKWCSMHQSTTHTEADAEAEKKTRRKVRNGARCTINNTQRRRVEHSKDSASVRVVGSCTEHHFSPFVEFAFPGFQRFWRLPIIFLDQHRSAKVSIFTAFGATYSFHNAVGCHHTYKRSSGLPSWTHTATVVKTPACSFPSRRTCLWQQTQ